VWFLCVDVAQRLRVPAMTTAAQIGARMVTSIDPPVEKVHTYANIDGNPVPITKSTQTIAGQTYVVDPLNRYRQPYGHISACTGIASHGHAEKKRLGGLHVPNLIKHTHTPSPGDVDRCMCNYMRPTNIVAVEAVYLEDEHIIGTLEYSKSLTSAHWGLSVDPKETDGVFTPCTRCSSEHLSERALADHHHPAKKALDGPVCWDIHSCHHACSSPHVVHGIFPNWKLFALALAIPLPLLLFTCCLGGCLLRLHRHGGRARAREELRQISNQPTNGTRLRALSMPLLGRGATSATAQPGNTTTAPASTTENTIAGPAAGAAAASEKAADPVAAFNAATTGSTPATEGAEGRGTLTRRAEEGRGQVTFAQPQEQAAQTTTTAAPAQTIMEHTEPVPVHDGTTDGAGTALDVPNMGMGSVRGRRMGRPAF